MVFSHNTKGGLFSNLEETKKKNIGDKNALLFSILYDLETFRTKFGYFHFKLCYPELTDYPYPCNEWTQTSNPVVESTITGYKALNITWDKNSLNQPFHGLGLSPASKRENLIDDAPEHSWWWSSIGSIRYHGSNTIPGPRPWKISKVILYAEYLP